MMTKEPYDARCGWGWVLLSLVFGVSMLAGCILWLGHDLQARLDVVTQRAINAEVEASACEKRAINAEVEASACEKENKKYHSISATNIALCRKWVKELPPDILISYGGLGLLEELPNE